jgi:uncharacterized phage protein (TIGR02218 family)
MTHISRIATCWKIRLGNNKLLCFTDLDQDLIYKGESYRCGSYFTPSSIVSSNELDQDNFSILGIIDGEFITKDSLIYGDLSNGYIEVFIVNVDNLHEEKIVLKTGWLGEIKYSKSKFTANIKSIGGKANNIIGNCYSSTCRTEFASKYCGKNIDDYSYNGSVTKQAELNSFIDSAREEPDGYFNQGTLLFTSGINSGRKYMIEEFRENKVSLNAVVDLKIFEGDTYLITVGCDKSIACCTSKFQNAINFRGEPYIPSKHKLVACN